MHSYAVRAYALVAYLPRAGSYHPMPLHTAHSRKATVSVTRAARPVEPRNNPKVTMVRPCPSQSGHIAIMAPVLGLSAAERGDSTPDSIWTLVRSSDYCALTLDILCARR